MVFLILERLYGDIDIHPCFTCVIHRFRIQLKTGPIIGEIPATGEPFTVTPVPGALVFIIRKEKRHNSITTCRDLHPSYLSAHLRILRHRNTYTDPKLVVLCNFRIIMVDYQGFKIRSSNQVSWARPGKQGCTIIDPSSSWIYLSTSLFYTTPYETEKVGFINSELFSLYPAPLFYQLFQ